MGMVGWGALITVRPLGAILMDINNRSCVRRALWNNFHPILTLWGARQLMFTVPNWTCKLKVGLGPEIRAFLSPSNSVLQLRCSRQQSCTHTPQLWAPCPPWLISSLDAQWQSPYKHPRKCISKTQHQTLMYFLEWVSSLCPHQRSRLLPTTQLWHRQQNW